MSQNSNIITESRLHVVNDVLTHLAFGIWAVMALWFFQERLYSDAGYFMSEVVHHESFWMELNRFMRVFSQWLPLLCIKLGFSLKTVLLAYSFGHVLFFYSMFLIGRYGLGNRQIGWLLVLTQTVGILHGFCSPGFELYYASAFLGLFAIILNKNENSTRHQVYLFLLVITMVINYQLIIFMIGGVMLLHFAEYKFAYWKSYLVILIGIVSCFLAKQLMTEHSYEVEKMEQFILNLTERTYSWNDYIKPLLYFYLEYYKEVWIIVFVTIALYLKQRQYFRAIGFFVFMIITQYIIALTYPSIGHSRYQEQCFYPLIFVACFPLIMELKGKFSLKPAWWFNFALFGLIVYRFWMISVGIKPFTHRVNYMHRIIEAAQNMEGNKFIAHEEWFNPTFGGMSFTMGMESMLLSGLNPSRKTIHIIRDSEWVWNEAANEKTLQDTNLYMFTFRSFYDRPDSFYYHKNANKNYYNFPAGKYRFLNGQVPKLDTIQQLKEALEIKTYVEKPYKAKTTDNILIKLTNKAAFGINSDQVKIAYHWWKDGQMVHWEGHRTPIEIDLLPNSEYYQYILLVLPQEAGQYELQVDAISDGSLGWLHFNQRVPILVESN